MDYIEDLEAQIKQLRTDYETERRVRASLTDLLKLRGEEIERLKAALSKEKK